MIEALTYIDYLGTFVFALTGATIASKSKFDFFGMFFLAFLTAAGGGTARDLILSERVFWTVDPVYLYIIFLSTLSTFFLMRVYERNSKLLFFLDTLGLGTFVVIGTHKALALNHNMETALVMGTISAVLGGILRSAFNKEQSILFKKELYATVAAASSLIFIALIHIEVSLEISVPIVVVSTIIIRYLAVRFKISLPTM